MKPVPDACSGDLLLHFPFDDNFNDVTCRHAAGHVYGSGVVRIVDDAQRGKVALFDGAARIEVREKLGAGSISIRVSFLLIVPVTLFRLLSISAAPYGCGQPFRPVFILSFGRLVHAILVISFVECGYELMSLFANHANLVSAFPKLFH